MSKGTVLIAGATGYLGRHLINAYKASGYRVRALVRRAQKQMPTNLLADELFIGEATKPETLCGCCDNMDLVVSALGITRQKDGLTYEQVDYRANHNLLEEAQQAEVQRFAYVHVLNAEHMKNVDMVSAKQKFASELNNSAIASTIIYPSGFFSDLREIFQMARRGRVYVFGNGRQLISPIHGADLALACVGATETGLSILNVGGPEILTQNMIASQAFEVLGTAPKITHIPVWLGRIAARMAGYAGFRTASGALDFLLTASSMDMSAPSYGTRMLIDEFKKELFEA